MNIVQFLNYTRISDDLTTVQSTILQLLYGYRLDTEAKVTLRPSWRNKLVTISQEDYVSSLRSEGRAPEEGAGSEEGAFVVLGRRSGKNLLADVVACYESLSPSYRGWGDSGIAPIYVVHFDKDEADKSAADFRARLSKWMPHVRPGHNWAGRSLVDSRGRPVVVHTTSNSPEFLALREPGRTDGLVIFNDLASFPDPWKSYSIVAPGMRKIVFTTGDTNGFVRSQINEIQERFAPVFYQIPTWEARSDMSGNVCADLWKSSVDRYPHGSEERKEAEKRFMVEWGAQYT